MMHNWHIFHFIPRKFFDKFDTDFRRDFSCKKCKSPQKIANKFVNVVYPPNGSRFHILSNVTPKILAIFGDFIRRYEDKSLNLRW